jgi:hypothetical protein
MAWQQHVDTNVSLLSSPPPPSRLGCYGGEAFSGSQPLQPVALWHTTPTCNWTVHEAVPTAIRKQ